MEPTPLDNIEVFSRLALRIVREDCDVDKAAEGLFKGAPLGFFGFEMANVRRYSQSGYSLFQNNIYIYIDLP